MTEDKALATDKAKAIISAAVRRVILHEPLESKEIACEPNVLVVGAGLAGISAALTLAQKNRHVFLVEKLPCIGVKVALYEDIFPTLECASCVLDPKLDEVLHNEQIDVLTFSEVEEVVGYYGNFTVKVRRKARFVDSRTCLGCGACFDVCPVKAGNEYNEGLDERGAIYVPYAGSLPNIAVIDKDHCLRWKGEPCNACEEACPFGSIKYEEEDQLLDLKVGAIVLATGFDLFDPRRAPQYGYGKIENVYTSLEFERLVNSTGPTGGEIVLKNGEAPKNIAFVHCVGSRTSEFHEHCSGVCCTYLLKFAHQARQKLPEVGITQLYSDFCLPGKESQGFFNRVVREDRVELIHMRDPDLVEIVEQDKTILITSTDVASQSISVAVDMVVLAPAIEGARDANVLASVFDIPVDESQFFVEDNPYVAPVSTTTDGIFIAGCAQGPLDIQGSVAQAKAAAGEVMSRLIPGEKLTLEPMTAQVDEAFCSGCKVCMSLCPYKAITYETTEKNAKINEVLCRGCGTCAAACPSGAIKAKHFTDGEISAEIEGLMQQV
ncbi:MAG: CoB--CoM heterodisulfide reductase iron-sulfur subunit A family protein [Deltaproteobacteria bacterium]|nr:CoB--CoM heterodisulfide reductase iron-sulfur subunit A family protein [Deltaproteobacteria bacterium]